MLQATRLKNIAKIQQQISAGASAYSTAKNAKGSNIAKGDTVQPSENREVANAAKGSELVDADNLKYVTIEHGAQAFEGDLRSTSGLGLGDGLYTHTAKWNEVQLVTYFSFGKNNAVPYQDIIPSGQSQRVRPVCTFCARCIK